MTACSPRAVPQRDLRRFARYLSPRRARRRPAGDRPARRLLRAGAALPGQAYEGDAGLDLTACERVVLEPGSRAVVPTGVAVEIPEGHAGLVVPRSGLAAKHGLSIVNAPGLIDAGYRGEVLVILHNTDRTEPFTVSLACESLSWSSSRSLSSGSWRSTSSRPTERGSRGHGSSGH